MLTKHCFKPTDSFTFLNIINDHVIELYIQLYIINTNIIYDIYIYRNIVKSHRL